MLKATPRTLLISLYLSAAALVFLPATRANAEEPEKTESSVLDDCSVPMTSQGFMSGLRVWIDPATGKIRQPTAEERKALAERTAVDALLNRSSDGLVVEHKPDGAKYVHLQGRFMHALVLTIAEDGTLIPQCIDDEDQLKDENEIAVANEPQVR